MEQTLKRCSKCILPETFPGILFNEKGVCNYCLNPKHKKERKPKGVDKLREIIEPLRNNDRKYDCMIALSGGRDSSFMLYYVVKKLGLKVLACSVDNCFVPKQTKSNIKNATDILNVDLVVKKHELVKRYTKHTIQSWMHKPSPAMIPFLCSGCTIGLRYGILQTMKEYSIPFMFYGTGEPALPFTEQYLSLNPYGKVTKLSLAVGFLFKIAKNPYYLKRPACFISYANEYLFRWTPFIRKIMMRKVGPGNLKSVSLFSYIKWEEEKIISVIQDELKWRKPSYVGSSWRADCTIAIFKNYLYLKTVGFSKNDELLSNMIRSNMITREEAMARLGNDNFISEQFVKDFYNDLGLDVSDLHFALERAIENKYDSSINLD